MKVPVHTGTLAESGHDFGNDTSADGTATFADSELQTFFHSDWLNQSNVQ